MTDTCKFCGEPIKWAVTEKGMNAPVVADPQGPLMLLPVEKGQRYPRAMTIPTSPPGWEVRTIRYVLHRVHCTGRGKR